MTQDYVNLAPDYRPQPNEPYMSPLMLAYFRKKLLDWREELNKETNDIMRSIQEESHSEPDRIDFAVIQSNRDIEVPLLEREHYLIYEIDAALKRIDDGTYGYCEETDKEIGVPRLEAWPIARLSIQAQRESEEQKNVKP